MKVVSISSILFGSIINSALAFNYRGYASSVSCIGANFGCSTGAAVCCSIPSGFGFSAQFDNLPAENQGQGYSDSGCTNILFTLFGPGTKCWNGGGAQIGSLNLFHSPTSFEDSSKEIESREVGNECTEPAFFEYMASNGIMRTIKVPSNKGSAETIAALYLSKDYTALASYDEYHVSIFGYSSDMKLLSDHLIELSLRQSTAAVKSLMKGWATYVYVMN